MSRFYRLEIGWWSTSTKRFSFGTYVKLSSASLGPTTSRYWGPMHISSSRSFSNIASHRRLTTFQHFPSQIPTEMTLAKSRILWTFESYWTNMAWSYITWWDRRLVNDRLHLDEWDRVAALLRRPFSMLIRDPLIGVKFFHGGGTDVSKALSCSSFILASVSYLFSVLDLKFYFILSWGCLYPHWIRL